MSIFVSFSFILSSNMLPVTPHFTHHIVNEKEYISHNIFPKLEFPQRTCIIWIIFISNRVNLECKHSDMTSPDMWHFLEIREHSQRTGARSVSKFPRWVVNSRPWENREGNQCLATSRRSYNGLWSNLGLGSQRIFYISTLHDLSPSTNLPS